MSRVLIAVRIPASLQEKLKSYLDLTGATKTEVVVNALAEYLGCAEAIPLGERMAEFERRLAALEAERRGT
ncbi:MAG: DNA-binding domain-containing protein [Xenococcaceae cyanobacterium]